MATTVYYCASSLDGYIAGADDSLDWLTGYQGSFEGENAEPDPMSEGGPYEDFYAGVQALVMGSATYEWILDHLDTAGGGEWPYRGKPCWVLSSRQLPMPAGEGVDLRVADSSVAQLYDEIAAAAGDGALWIVGGGGVASQFAEEGRLDEVHLTVVPVVLGDGKRLFERPLPSGSMQLTGTRAFNNGMVELRYALRQV
ncbi:MAG TPA: dihydrofolate reductase family protein [Solirubrobacterales bacterium]|nr:dihydrofolate reductase family protein [Solirubrobacterales bacterium]